MTPRISKSDLDLLQGAWTITALEADGQNMPAEELGGAHIVVKGDRFQSNGMGSEYEGKLTLDTAARPKTFDLTFTKGPEKGNTNLGIYELAGDTWKICLAMRGTVRPKEFRSTPGSGIAVETLARGVPKPTVEKRKAVAETPAEAGAPSELEGEWSLISGFLNGKPMEPDVVQWGRRTWRGNRTMLKFGPQVYIDATFTVDATKSPRAVDFVHVKGMYAGKQQLGIYESDGKTMKLCVSPPGRSRPADFAERGENTVTVWKFEKK